MSYRVPEIATFKESQHHATTTRRATVKVVASSGLHVDQSANTRANQLKLREQKVAGEIKSTLVKFCSSRQHSWFQVSSIPKNDSLFLQKFDQKIITKV